MKIAFCGNFSVHWTTENHVASSLETLGHTVHRVQENRIETFSQALGDIGMDADLVLYQRTWGFPGAAAAWEHYATNDIPTATFSLDLYANISRRQMVVDGDPMFKTKYLFSADGSPEAQAFFEAHGIRHFWIKPGVYDVEAYLAEPDMSYQQYQVGFVGTSGANYHPEWPWRTELLDFLRRTYNDKFIKVGHPDNVVRGSELNVLYASVPVFVGDTLCPGFNYPNYWSDRVYETLGRSSTLLIHPNVPGLEDEFQDFVHLLFYEYGDFDGLRDRIVWGQEHPVEAKKMGLAGHEYVRNNCTYVHRMRELLEVVGREEGWTDVGDG